MVGDHPVDGWEPNVLASQPPSLPAPLLHCPPMGVRMSVGKKILMAVGVTVVFFLVLEGILFLVGVISRKEKFSRNAKWVLVSGFVLHCATIAARWFFTLVSECASARAKRTVCPSGLQAGLLWTKAGSAAPGSGANVFVCRS